MRYRFLKDFSELT